MALQTPATTGTVWLSGVVPRFAGLDLAPVGRFKVTDIVSVLRIVVVLVLTLPLLLRGAWAWMPVPAQLALPLAAAAAPVDEAPCEMHAMAPSDRAHAPAWHGSEPASTLCHASAGACCLAVMPSLTAAVPGAMPIASLCYPPLAVPAPAFFGEPHERPPRRT